jgi:transcriptional regulator with XRE-family HTH domain
MTVSPAVGIVPEWTIGDRLRKARELTGLEKAEFAAQLDVSRNTITNYEQGKVKPRTVVLRAWAMRCGVSLEWLRDGTAPTGNLPPGAPVAQWIELPPSKRKIAFRRHRRPLAIAS